MWKSTINRSPEAAKAIANHVNVFSGYGSYGRAGHAADAMSYIIWSPRLLASRFQVLTGQPLLHGGGGKAGVEVRLRIAAEYGKMLTGMAALYALAKSTGAEVEDDPRSSDFGKWRYGNTRLDPMAGLSQVTHLLSNWTTGEKKTLAGKVKKLRGDLKFGEKDLDAETMRFLRTKFTPTLGTGWNIGTGKNVVGEKTTPQSVATETFSPLVFQDVFDVMRENGIPAGLALETLSIFGMGLQSFEGPPRRP
jgi:hypothetical protein